MHETPETVGKWKQLIQELHCSPGQSDRWESAAIVRGHQLIARSVLAAADLLAGLHVAGSTAGGWAGQPSRIQPLG